MEAATTSKNRLLLLSHQTLAVSSISPIDANETICLVLDIHDRSNAIKPVVIRDSNTNKASHCRAKRASFIPTCLV